jgi:hypothetical protein
MSAFGGEAQIFCSLSALPVVTDAVEKVSAKKLWNSNLKRWNPANRFLNQDCAFWPAPGSEDTELGVLMEPEVGHGETEVYSRVQA